MAIEFCDWEPCSWLQVFVDQLLHPPPVLEDHPIRYTARMVTAVLHPVKGLKNGAKPGVPRVVLFTYCPFCGTRIEGNKDIEDWIEQRRRLDDRRRSTQSLAVPFHCSPALRQP